MSKSDERAVSELHLRRHGEIRESGLLVTADDLDLDPGALAHGLDERVAVACHAQTCRTDRRRGYDLLARGLLGHVRDRVDRASHRLFVQVARPVESLTEPRHLGAIDDRPPLAVAPTLADHELDRVRADVDDREAAEPDELLEPAWDAHVSTQVEPELPDGRGHERRILGLHGDRPQHALVRAQLGKLGHRSADGHVPAPLVHLDCTRLR